MNLISLIISKGGRSIRTPPPSPDPHMCMYNTPEIHFHDVYYITYSTSSNSPGKHNTVHLSVTMVTVTFNVGYKYIPRRFLVWEKKKTFHLDPSPFIRKIQRSGYIKKVCISYTLSTIINVLNILRIWNSGYKC